MDTSRHLSLAPSLIVRHIPPEHLNSIGAYNQLKVGRFLYEEFREYDYMLTYELDAFVFRDDLLAWCEAGWDYIGAPFFEGFHRASETARVTGVGNSGFSLRNIQSCLRVLDSRKAMYSLRYWMGRYQRRLFTRKQTARNVLTHLLFRPQFRQAGRYYLEHEDIFWSDLVPQHFPWFRIADTHSAARFSFEINPARLYAENQGLLPFGCHKWAEIDPDFWRSFIESFGHDMSAAE